MSEIQEQIIERLKNNERGWIFLTEEEKKCIRIANSSGKVENLTFAGNWENNLTGFNLSDVGALEIFRICSDYQSKSKISKYIDCEITENTCSELVCSFPHPFSGNYGTRLITVLPAIKTFRGFWSNATDIKGHFDIRTPLDCVAARKADGYQVIARFEMREVKNAS